MEPMNVLVSVKERLFEKGWWQHEYGTSSGPNCILGAITQVMGTTRTCEEDETWDETFNLTVTALASVIDVGWDRKDCMVVNFNDGEGTTFSDVVDAIDREIKSLEE